MRTRLPNSNEENPPHQCLSSYRSCAQALFSSRSLHLHFSLEYVAENLDVPCVVLQYPSKRELIEELEKDYAYVCVSFLLAVFHHMKDVVALVRKHAPKAKIVLGGYGTVLPDDFLTPYADHICREEGVAYMRRLLGEPAIEAGKTYKHPLIVSQLKVFVSNVSRTGMIFAGLGCPYPRSHLRVPIHARHLRC